MNATTDDEKPAAVRVAPWIGASAFAACVYGAGLGALVPTQFLVIFGLGIALFALSFALGPLAVAFCAMVLAEQSKLWAELFFDWIPCCPNGNSDGWIGILLFGSVFVGGSYSSYLLIQLFRKRSARLWHVVAGSLLLAMIWLVVMWNVSEACRSHACRIS